MKGWSELSLKCINRKHDIYFVNSSDALNTLFSVLLHHNM